MDSYLQLPELVLQRKKSETQVKSRDIRDKRGGSEYTIQKRIEKRKNMEVINID